MSKSEAETRSQLIDKQLAQAGWNVKDLKRNRDRFPADFLFQLTQDEKAEVVANCDHLQNLRFPKALPFAFTEHGAIQAANVMAQRKFPVENRLGSGDFNPTSNKIKVMTMKVSKGLEFPLVALSGVGHMPGAGVDEKEAARVFYVAATRATQRLVMGVGGQGTLGQTLLM